MTFVEYNAESRILLVSVEHFSSHELNIDGLEDEELPLSQDSMSSNVETNPNLDGAEDEEISQSQESMSYNVESHPWEVTFGSNNPPALTQPDLDVVQDKWKDFDNSLAKRNSDRFQDVGDMVDSINSIDPEPNWHRYGLTPNVIRYLVDLATYLPGDIVNTTLKILSEKIEKANGKEKICYLYPHVINPIYVEDEKATEALKKKLKAEGLSGEAIDNTIKIGSGL